METYKEKEVACGGVCYMETSLSLQRDEPLGLMGGSGHAFK